MASKIAKKKASSKNTLKPLIELPELTFDQHDRFQRKDFADKLTKAIKTFSPFYDDAYVLSLNAPFGSGKTTFIQMWYNMLKTEYDMTCIYLNAWEHDFDDEPLVAILSTLLAHTKNHLELKKAAFAAMGSTANDVISKFSGVNVEKAIDAAAKAGDIEAIGADLYKEYHFKFKAFDKLRDSLSQYIFTLESKPLVIFVDELDRARPDYSVKFLETIKHIFPVRGICFVLAVDRGQLQKSVAQLYGDIKFEDYYLRFVTNEANLPKLNTTNDLQPFLADLEREFIGEKQEQGVKFPFQENDKRFIQDFLAICCKGFELKPRQIQKMYRKFSQFMAVSSDNKKFAKKSWVEASIALIATSIKKPTLYQKIGAGQACPKEVYEFIQTNPFINPYGERNDHNITCVMMAFLINNVESQKDEIVNICLPYFKNVLSPEDEDEKEQRRYVLSNLSSLVDRWGIGGNGYAFQELYKSIESWSSFLEEKQP